MVRYHALIQRRWLFRLAGTVVVAGIALATVTAQPTMYWSNTYAGSLQRTVIGSGLIEELVEGFVERPQHLRLDIGNGKLYWSIAVQGPSPNNAAIQRSNLDGSDLENIVFSGFCNPYCPISAMALDTVQDSLYWFTWNGAFPAIHALYRSDHDGAGARFIGTSDNVVLDVELDRSNSEMFWIDSKLPAGLADHSIRRATLRGSDPLEIVHVIDGKPLEKGHLAVDRAGDRVYWITENRAIRRAHLDGTEIQDLVSVEGDSTVLGDIAVDLDAGKMYWSATYGGIVTFPVGVIHRANLDGSEMEDVLVLESAAIGSFAMDMGASVATEHGPGIPSSSRLGAAYPNPAATSARIPISISEPTHVAIIVYDVLGRALRTADLGLRTAGLYTAEIRVDDLPGGLYVYRAVLGDESHSRSFTVRR